MERAPPGMANGDAEGQMTLRAHLWLILGVALGALVVTCGLFH